MFFGVEGPSKAAHANRSFERRSLVESRAKIMSWSADYLTASIDPPAGSGMIEFDEGGRLSVDFTDVTPDQLASGLEVEMTYRISAVEPRTGFRRYFWKARPVNVASAKE